VSRNVQTSTKHCSGHRTCLEKQQTCRTICLDGDFKGVGLQKPIYSHTCDTSMRKYACPWPEMSQYFCSHVLGCDKAVIENPMSATHSEGGSQCSADVSRWLLWCDLEVRIHNSYRSAAVCGHRFCRATSSSRVAQVQVSLPIMSPVELMSNHQTT